MTDDVDKRLISLLRKDGRLTNIEAAKQLSISRISVQRRIAKLRNEGIIYFTVFVNPAKSDSPLGVLIGLNVIQSEISTTINELLKQPSVAMVTRTLGIFNLLLFASFLDIEVMSRFFLDVLSRMKAIRNRETFILLHNEKNLNRTPDIDSLDKDIIDLLQEDGRRSTVSIAKRLGVSKSTVHRRIKQLQKENRVVVLALLNQTKVDWYWPAVVGISVQYPYLLDVQDQLTRNPAVNYVFCTTGRFDIMASIEANSREKLFNIVEYELAIIKGIKDYEVLLSQETMYGSMWRNLKLRFYRQMFSPIISGSVPSEKF